jgi:polyisoprenoid-binding protein YceI
MKPIVPLLFLAVIAASAAANPPPNPDAKRFVPEDVSIPVYQLETTNRDLDAELYSSVFFDYIKFRDMHFVSTDIKRTGPRTALVTGDLTIRDVTKPLTLTVTFHGAGVNPFVGDEVLLGFDAMGSLKRSEFGLGKWVPLVSDETRIFISAEFKKQ